MASGLYASTHTYIFLSYLFSEDEVYRDSNFLAREATLDIPTTTTAAATTTTTTTTPGRRQREDIKHDSKRHQMAPGIDGEAAGRSSGERPISRENAKINVGEKHQEKNTTLRQGQGIKKNASRLAISPHLVPFVCL
jgi:hypothetical protein